MNDQWEFYKDVGDSWRWRRIDLNGVIVGTSTGGYPNKPDCEDNARHNGWDGAGEYLRTTDPQPPADMSEDGKEERRNALDLYKDRGFSDGNAFVTWLGAEKVKAGRFKGKKQNLNVLVAIVVILFVIVSVLVLRQFMQSPPVVLSETILPDPKVMMVVMDPKDDEKLVVFGDVHFDYDKSSLSLDAKSLLDGDVQDLKENPAIHVRMAGYMSAEGSEENNQKLSVRRANTVREYLIEKGIAPERITVIGYGRTRPAVYEVKPSDLESKEALQNMRVLFEVVVK